MTPEGQAHAQQRIDRILAARYAGDFEAALIANANAGGDNGHRGAVLGAILGAGLGFPAIPER